MRKSARKKIIILFLGMLAFVFIFKALKSQKRSTQPVVKTEIKPAAKKPKVDKQVSVRVAKVDLHPGDQLTQDLYSWRSMAENKVPVGAITNSMRGFELDGKVVTFPIKKNAAILVSNLSSVNAGWETVTPGMAVHAFKINANRGIGAIIQPNTYVRVLYTEAGKTVVVIDHARVIGIIINNPPKQTYKPGEAPANLPDPKDLVDDDAFIEVTPQMAQMLAIDHGGKFALIPIKYHPELVTPVFPYNVGDLSRTYLPANSKSGHKIIRSIKGDKVIFHNVYDGTIDRKELEKSPVTPKKPTVKLPDERLPLKPPYRLVEEVKE